MLLPLLAFTAVHKFYLSVTNVSYSEKSDALQVTTRFFIDDINTVIKERYGVDAAFGSEKESKIGQETLEKYVRAKFAITRNGEPVEYVILGKKYDTDVIVMYIEVLEIDLPSVTSIGIENEILTDVFEEQQNVVHFNISGKKKSFVLLKSDAKGMLKL